MEKAKELKEKGNQEFTKGLFDQALSLFEKAAALTSPEENPNELAIIHNNRGLCY